MPIRLALISLVLAACGAAPYGQTTTTIANGIITTTTTVSEDGVRVAETALGEVLVGPGGFTLYLFTSDTPGSSNCGGDCISLWPPLEGEVAIDASLDASKFGTITRGDGSSQLTVNGWPLYFYSGDTAPGDTNGQGVEASWYVVAPNGEPIGAPDDGGGYDYDYGDYGFGGDEDGATSGAITVAETSLGPTLVDGAGFTLYVFLSDPEGASNCTGSCAGAWPPVPGDTAIGEGLDAGLFTIINRDDGSTQLTIAGRPLYRYRADSAPGDVRGHGVGDVWFAAAPDGSLLD